MKRFIAASGLFLVAVGSTFAGVSVGFGRKDVTPELGVPIGGYAGFRTAKTILDPLEAVAVAFDDGTNTAVVCAVDNLHLNDPVVARVQELFVSRTGLPKSALFLHSTHTHTSAEVGIDREPVKRYLAYLVPQVVAACEAAIADRAPAALSVARTAVDRVSFCRRYRMKDGKVHTNPGVGNPDIVAPARQADEQVQLLRIDRVGKPSVAVVNFQTHPDVIGGDNISGDWPALLRRQLETALDGGVRCLFINGAQGDVNHICVDPRPGETNGMHDDEDCPRGYARAKVIAQKLAGAVLGVWGETVPLAGGAVRSDIRMVKVASNKRSPEKVAEAKRLRQLVREGKRDQIPERGMDYTALMVGVSRAIELEQAPDFFEMPLSAVVIGNAVAFCGFPGEPFNAIGEAVKAKSPCTLTIPACLTNGSRSYFPSAEAFAGGGYEAESSRFAPSVEHALVEGQLEMIQSL